jgi:hypothetical protein
MKRSFTKSFRFRLIAPIAAALLVMIVSAIIFTRLTQNSSNRQLNRLVVDSFDSIENTIGQDLGGLSTQLGQRHVAMRMETSKVLETSSAKALEETAWLNSCPLWQPMG